MSKTLDVWMGVALAVWLTAVVGRAVEVTWEPERPEAASPVQIEIHNCTQGGTLHWGVNGKQREWEQAVPAHRPPGSTLDGLATRTRLSGPDSNGVCRVELGPFEDPQQPVHSIDFAIQWSDGDWNNNGQGDFHIPVGFLRVVVAPEQPTWNDVVTVTVRRSRPGGVLHWGVNAGQGTWQLLDPVYWPPGTQAFGDGQAVRTPLPDPDADGNSVLQLGPFNRGQQVVRSLHLAVNWGDEWDTDQGRNYGVTIGPGADGPSVTFLAPRDGEVATEGLAATLELAGTERADLWLDGSRVATLQGPDLTWPLPLSTLDWGLHRLVARAESGGQVSLADRTFWRLPEVEVAELPAGARLGATLGEGGDVTFALRAPGKRFVSLVGDFNDWDGAADIMRRTGDGTWWTRKALPPGTHHYQFNVEGVARIADPYATDVTWVDADGDESHLPADAKAALHLGQAPYVWGDADYVRPPLDGLLIYEVFIEDLCPGEGYAGLIDRLDEIRALGVNALGPLPFTEYPGEAGWGYNPAFHFAPESTYGTPNDLKRLVDEAHQRGMAVILDVVLNHMDKQAPLHQLYGEAYDQSPYFRRFEGPNWGMPDLDQESEDFKRYAADSLQHWIREYHIDGFRYDATRWVGWEGHHDWGASWFAYAAKQADPKSYHIAEHLPIEPALVNTTEMDASWHAHFRWRMREMIEEAELNESEFRRILDPREVGLTTASQRVAYTESHDDERVMRELLKRGYSVDEAIRRAETALAVTLTAPGVAMIFAGQEFGEYAQRVVGLNPLHLQHLDFPVYQSLRDTTARLGSLRTTHPALRGDNLQVTQCDPDADIAVYHRVAGSAAVVTAINLSAQDRAVTVHLPVDGTWQNVSANAPVSGARPITLQLPPGGSAVLACDRTP